MKKLHNKVCIVTGSGRGIGKEIAEIFALEGAKIAIWDINQNAGSEVKTICETLGTEAIFQLVDVTNRVQIGTAVEEIINKWGVIDVLVNNAGITKDGFLAKMTEEDFDAVININLKGVFNCTQFVVQKMMVQNSGKIICISSIVGRDGNIGQTNYAASKSAVIGMVKTWGKELARFNIKVNAIAPGFIETEMTQKVPEKIIEYVKEKTPLKRMGSPNEVAKLALFLASEDSDFITGQVISIDGGLVL